MNDQRSIVNALAAKYPVFAVATIERWVADATDRFKGASVTKYLPVLVQRSVDATLSELSRPEGTSTDLLSLDKLADDRPVATMPDYSMWQASHSVPLPRA